jgi:hypothetical protein
MATHTYKYHGAGKCDHRFLVFAPSAVKGAVACQQSNSYVCHFISKKAKMPILGHLKIILKSIWSLETNEASYLVSKPSVS